jgi:FHA domain-containing protein
MLILNVTGLDGQPLQSPLRGKFGVLGGTIGAIEGNTIVLEDPQERVAELEANIISSPRGFVIRNCASDPLFVNGTPVETSAEALVDAGSEIRIGPFTLHAEIVEAPAKSAPKAAPTAAAAPISAAAPTAATAALAAAPAPVAPAATPAAGPAAGTSHDALLQALAEGLRMDKVEVPGGLTPEFMETLGRLLREVTQGTIDLLRIRAEAKSKMHANLTMIGSREINPLKAAWDAEVALQHLLAPQRADMLEPQRAMREACDDLRLHDRGLVAGIHAALTGLLARFDPATLEQRLGGNSRFESMMPGGGKARRWDQLVELYGDISVEAEQDFWALFDKEFLKAYAKGLEPEGEGTLLGRV